MVATAIRRSSHRLRRRCAAPAARQITTPSHRRRKVFDMLRNRVAAAGLSCIAAMIALTFAAVRPAHAQVYSSGDRWASWSSGPWTISNNVWGSNPGPQTLYVNNVNNWYVNSWQWGSNVESAPNITILPQKTLAHLSQADFWFSVSSPSDAVYDWMIDIFTAADQNAQTTDEVMIFLNHTTPVGGWGQQVYGATSIPPVTSGDPTFYVSQVWEATPQVGGSNHRILMVFPTNQFLNNQAVDTLAIMRWLKNQNLLQNNYYYSLGFVCEIWSTNYYENFDCNWLGGTVKDGSGNVIGQL
jgi:hypothetical protein